jgi:hypothetical protein
MRTPRPPRRTARTTSDRCAAYGPHHCIGARVIVARGRKPMCRGSTTVTGSAGAARPPHADGPHASTTASTWSPSPADGTAPATADRRDAVLQRVLGDLRSFRRNPGPELSYRAPTRRSKAPAVVPTGARPPRRAGAPGRSGRRGQMRTRRFPHPFGRQERRIREPSRRIRRSRSARSDRTSVTVVPSTDIHADARWLGGAGG